MDIENLKHSSVQAAGEEGFKNRYPKTEIQLNCYTRAVATEAIGRLAHQDYELRISSTKEKVFFWRLMLNDTMIACGDDLESLVSHPLTEWS